MCMAKRGLMRNGCLDRETLRRRGAGAPGGKPRLARTVSESVGENGIRMYSIDRMIASKALIGVESSDARRYHNI